MRYMWYVMQSIPYCWRKIIIKFIHIISLWHCTLMSHVHFSWYIISITALVGVFLQSPLHPHVCWCGAYYWLYHMALSVSIHWLIIIFPMKKGDMNYKPIHTKYNYLIISSLKPCHIPSPKIFTRTIPIHARFHSTPYSPIILNYVPYGTIFLSSIKCH